MATTKYCNELHYNMVLIIMVSCLNIISKIGWTIKLEKTYLNSEKRVILRKLSSEKSRSRKFVRRKFVLGKIVVSMLGLE